MQTVDVSNCDVLGPAKPNHPPVAYLFFWISTYGKQYSAFYDKYKSVAGWEELFDVIPKHDKVLFAEIMSELL